MLFRSNELGKKAVDDIKSPGEKRDVIRAMQLTLPPTYFLAALYKNTSEMEDMKAKRHLMKKKTRSGLGWSNTLYIFAGNA